MESQADYEALFESQPFNPSTFMRVVQFLFLYVSFATKLRCLLNNRVYLTIVLPMHSYKANVISDVLKEQTVIKYGIPIQSCQTRKTIS